jgi:predicted permease
MDEEMRFHVAMHAEEGVHAGLRAGESRRRALVAFGGMERHKEAARDALVLGAVGEWWRELRRAGRALGRRPGFALVVVLTLAIGIAANTAVFAVADATLLRGLPYPDADRLVQLWQGTPSGRQWVSGPDYADWRDGLRTMEGVAAFTPASVNMALAASAENVSAAEVTAGFFETLGVMPALGRTPRPDEDRPSAADVVVLSAVLHARLFGGDPEIIGKTALVDGSPAVVIGVMPPAFDYPRGTEVWRPLRLGAEDWQLRRGIDWLMVVARVQAGVESGAAQADLERVAGTLARAYPETNARDRIEAVPLQEQLRAGIATPLHLLMGAVVFVLALVCANVAGLVLARGSTRARELAVRRALGAEPHHLRRSLLAEAGLLALVGGASGLLLGVLVAGVLVAIAPPQPGALPDVGLSARVIAFTAVTAVVCGLLFGVAPAVRSARVAPAVALASGTPGAGERRSAQRTRRTLVVVQIALAVVLVTGAGLLVRTLVNLRGEDPGFRAEGVLTARIALTPAQYPDSIRLRALYDALLARVRSLPGVHSAGLVSPLPLAGGEITFSYQVEGEPPPPTPDEAPLSGFRTVTSGYFAAMGIPLLRGRDFASADDAGARVVAIDETLAARHFPDRNPLGERIDVSGATRTVVAVVGAVRHSALRTPPRPTLYIPYAHRARPGMTLVLRGEGEPLQLAGPVRAALRGLDPAQPMFAIRPMAEYVSLDVATPRFLALILGGFAATALLLALLGIYGVVAYAVAQRTREIGIRMALGARPRTLLASIVADGLALTVTGVAAGLALALALSRLLEGVLYGVRGFDPTTLAAVAALVAGAALVASYLPARRAARLDPSRTLRAN